MSHSDLLCHGICTYNWVKSLSGIVRQICTAAGLSPCITMHKYTGSIARKGLLSKNDRNWYQVTTEVVQNGLQAGKKFDVLQSNSSVRKNNRGWGGKCFNTT